MMRFIVALGLNALLCVWPEIGNAEQKSAQDIELLGDCKPETPIEQRYAACTKVIEEAKLKGDSLAFAYLQRGLSRAETGDLESGIADFDKALEISPTATDALYDRGAANAQLNRWQAALVDFDRLLKIAPKDGDALYIRAWVYSQMGNYERAIADLDSVLSLYPKDRPALFDRAGLLLRVGRPNDAAIDFTRVLEQDPEAADAAFNRGRAYYQLGRYKDATNDFHRALTLLPNNPYAALRLHLSLLGQGQDGSVELKKAATALTDQEWPQQLILYYLGELKAEDVLAAIGNSVGDENGNSGNMEQSRILCEANYYLGALAKAMGKEKEARGYFEAAVKTKAQSSTEYIDAILATRTP